jgi:hypothetical protein
VRPVAGLVQSQLPDPGVHDPRVLPSRQMYRAVQSAWKRLLS